MLALWILWSLNAAAASEKLCSAHEADWTQDERLVWKNLCTSTPQTKAHGTRPKVRASFIRDLYVNARYRDRLALMGGAVFSKVIVVGDLSLSYLTLPGTLGFLDSDFGGGSINLNSAHVSGEVRLYKNLLRSVSFRGAQIDGDVTVQNSGELVIGDNAKFGGNVTVHGAREIDAEDAQVKGALRIEQMPYIGSIRTGYTTIGGILGLTRVGAPPLPSSERLEVSVTMPHVKVGQDILVRDSSLEYLLLHEAEVSGSMRITGSSLGTMEARGLRIGKELVIEPSANRPTTWTPSAELDLRNANVARIVSPRILTAWPNTMELAYLQFGSFDSEPEYAITLTDGTKNVLSQVPKDKWFVEWLSRATLRDFDPQPYRQVMESAGKSGQDAVQSAVGYAKKERERAQACRHDDASRAECISLTFANAVTGYGYKYDRTLWVILGFVFVGTLAFRFVPESDKKGLKYGIAYSFDTLLPLIHLRKLHDEVDITNWVRYYFYVHRLAGWAVGSFLVAALSGFTK